MSSDTCIIALDGDRIEARYEDDNGRPRSYLIAYVSDRTIEWRRGNTVATIGSVEIEEDGSMYIKIPIE